jgi:hypothetical protein
MQLIKPDTLEDLTSALNDLLADEVVCITADDFTKLTGDDLNFPVTEGRFLIGNLSARANCASCCLPICCDRIGWAGEAFGTAITKCADGEATPNVTPKMVGME